MTRPSRIRWVAVLLPTAVLIGLLSGSEPPAAPAARLPPPAERQPRRTAPHLAPAARVAPAPTPVGHPGAAPAITSAVLDRTSLCPGQSTLLRITASDADDDDLRYQAALASPALGGPRFGFGRWIRVVAPPQVGRYQVIATVEDPTRLRDAVPLDLAVRDCPEQPAFDVSELRIQHTERDAAVHEFDLGEAREAARRAGLELEAVRWQFGDGSSGPAALRVRHAYPIDMRRRYTYHLVRADVLVGGQPAQLDYGLTLYSYAAANLQAGYVALAADVERGVDSDARIRYVVTFSNVTPYAALAREFELTCLDAAGLPRERWREPLDLTVPGEDSMEQTLELDRQRCPGGATYELFGDADAGYAVGGIWSYKLRPSTRVADVREARERARRVLGLRGAP